MAGRVFSVILLPTSDATSPVILFRAQGAAAIIVGSAAAVDAPLA